MKPSAALLIDLENFVLSRFDHFNDEGIRGEDRPSFAEDLKNLVKYAHRMAGMPLAVRRAYADFDTLRVDPQDLMRQGVEPVQVFRLSGKSANKNAADMKLAMDAVSLLGAGSPFEHVVLVSGDADFIPVILELKRRGHTVSVIAVTGATNELIQRFVDNFELFEDLVSADGARPQPKAKASVAAPSANGNGSKGVAKAAPRQAPPAHEPHSPAHYRHLLASGRTDANEARVLAVPWASLKWVCDAVVPALAPPTGRPATSVDLMSALQAAARATGAPDLAAHVALIHSAVRCSLPVPTPEGVYALTAETTGDALRARLLRYVTYVLGCRLAESKVAGAIRPEALAQVFDPGAELNQATEEISAALAEARAELVVTPPGPAPKAFRADENHVHTPDGYRKLLQKGGPKNSGETEHMRVHTAPWPSVVRVCADAFAALAPNGALLQRGQFLEKLYAAEEEVHADNYRSHVRRAFSLLILSHAVLEEGDRVRLHPEVADPGDIRWAVLGILLKLVAIRLEEKGLTDRVRADVFVAAIEAGPFTDELLPEIAHAIDGMYLSAEAPTEPTAAAGTQEPQGELLPIPPDDAPAPEARSDGDIDPFAFDGALPEHAPAAEPFPIPDVPVPPASFVDVSALTSAAVAAVVEPAVQVIPAADQPPAPEPPEELPLAQIASDPDPELVVFSLPVEAPAVAARPDDELPLEVPVGDWLDDDSIFAPPEAAERITERLTGSSTRLPKQPPALYADLITERLTGSSARLAPLPPQSETRNPVAKIHPPPLPPLPPESV